MIFIYELIRSRCRQHQHERGGDQQAAGFQPVTHEQGGAERWRGRDLRSIDAEIAKVKSDMSKLQDRYDKLVKTQGFAGTEKSA